MCVCVYVCVCVSLCVCVCVCLCWWAHLEKIWRKELATLWPTGRRLVSISWGGGLVWASTEQYNNRVMQQMVLIAKLTMKHLQEDIYLIPTLINRRYLNRRTDSQAGVRWPPTVASSWQWLMSVTLQHFNTVMPRTHIQDSGYINYIVCSSCASFFSLSLFSFFSFLFSILFTLM